MYGSMDNPENQDSLSKADKDTLGSNRINK
jgi:hypothetical protein